MEYEINYVRPSKHLSLTMLTNVYDLQARQITVSQYPIAGQTKNPEAWSIISKVLRDFDIAKIGSYKEDLDTLLVFVRPTRS